MSTYATIDWKTQKLIHYGTLNCSPISLTSKAALEERFVHCFLFEDYLLMTQETKDSKFTLRVIEKKVENHQSPYKYFPIIDLRNTQNSLNSAISVKDVSNFSFRIVVPKPPQIINFTARTKEEKKQWIEHLSKHEKKHVSRDGKLINVHTPIKSPVSKLESIIKVKYITRNM